MSKTLARISVVILVLTFPVYISALFLRWICNGVIRFIDAMTDAMDRRVDQPRWQAGSYEQAANRMDRP